MKVLKNVIAYAETCGIYANFCLCNFENAIICRKICDLRILAKYAIAYAIAYNRHPYFLYATWSWLHFILPFLHGLWLNLTVTLLVVSMKLLDTNISELCLDSLLARGPLETEMSTSRIGHRFVDYQQFNLLTFTDCCRRPLFKPKFHYADFKTKSGTSSRQSCGLVVYTNHESSRHKSRHRLSWFVSATSPRTCLGLCRQLCRQLSPFIVTG